MDRGRKWRADLEQGDKTFVKGDIQAFNSLKNDKGRSWLHACYAAVDPCRDDERWKVSKENVNNA